MKRPHVVFRKPPSAGTHGLRRKSALDAFRRVRGFLERATDCTGARELALARPHELDDETRAHFPAGEWRAGRELEWSGAQRSKPGDAPAVLGFDALEALIVRLAAAPLAARAQFEYLHRDPRTGALLPYAADDFAGQRTPSSRVMLWLAEGGSNQVSLEMVFPWPDITEEIVAVHDAAVDTMGVTLSPPYWMRYTPSKRGQGGSFRKLDFDRGAWVSKPATADEAPLLDQIAAAPDDDAPRQVYADVLLAQGDPRGTFINVQCELARLAEDAPQRRELAALEARLLREHGKAWSRLPRKLGATLRRGFVDEVRVRSVGELLMAASDLREAAPLLTTVAFEARVSPWDAALLEVALDRLPLRAIRMTPRREALSRLAELRVFARLRSLALQIDAPEIAAELEACCRDGAFATLETLGLAGRGVAPALLVRIGALCPGVRVAG